MSTAFGEALHRLRSERGLSLRQLARLIPCSAGYLGQLEISDRRPSPEFAARLDDVLGARGELATGLTAVTTAISSDDELDALDLADRVAASDISPTTLDALERAVDRLAIAYQGTPPAALLPDVRRYLGYVAQLIGKRSTLEQSRRLLVVGGWLSLLAATLNIDLHQRPAANARLSTAVTLADHAGHNEIAAWCLETRAWDALTEGNFRLAVDLSQAAQHVAPRDGSAFIQATAQEGRAWARLGDGPATRDALDRVAGLVSPLPPPENPEHHYQYDPAKQLAYTATTLAWVRDPGAEGYAREVLTRLESGVDGGQRPRRTASARLDLALALLAADRPDEAAGQAQAAIESGRIVPSNAWRAAEIVTAVERAGLPEAVDLRDAYETLVEPRDVP